MSVCAIFQNEAPYLKEWIEFHRLVGVEHFFLYNNESSDDFDKVLRGYVDEGIVEWIDWPSSSGELFWIGTQKPAYNDCIRRCKKATKWLALIDIDEFMVPMGADDLLSFLKQFELRPNVGAIRMHWQLFGTSGLKSLPEDKLLIESLTQKAPSYYISDTGLDNRRYKSIVRPKAVKSYETHFGVYHRGYTVYPEEKKEEPIQIDHIRLHHYWTRGEDFFYGTKLDRRLEFSPLSREALIWKAMELNQVEDLTMLRFVPELSSVIWPSVCPDGA